MAALFLSNTSWISSMLREALRPSLRRDTPLWALLPTPLTGLLTVAVFRPASAVPPVSRLNLEVLIPPLARAALAVTM